MNKPKLLLYVACALCLSVNSFAQDKSFAVPEVQEIELSPIGTLKVYYEAVDRKDIEAIKKYLSQGTLEMLGKYAKTLGKTLDEAMRDSHAATDNQEPMPEFGDEIIDGETATVNIKAKSGASVTMPFVKENGRWKIALDKFAERLTKSSPK